MVVDHDSSKLRMHRVIISRGPSWGNLSIGGVYLGFPLERPGLEACIEPELPGKDLPILFKVFEGGFTLQDEMPEGCVVGLTQSSDLGASGAIREYTGWSCVVHARGVYYPKGAMSTPKFDPAYSFALQSNLSREVPEIDPELHLVSSGFFRLPSTGYPPAENSSW